MGSPKWSTLDGNGTECFRFQPRSSNLVITSTLTSPVHDGDQPLMVFCKYQQYLINNRTQSPTRNLIDYCVTPTNPAARQGKEGGGGAGDKLQGQHIPPNFSDNTHIFLTRGL